MSKRFFYSIGHWSYFAMYDIYLNYLEFDVLEFIRHRLALNESSTRRVTRTTKFDKSLQAF